MRRYLVDALIGIGLLLLICLFVTRIAKAQTAPITVPPKWTASQEQASALAVPESSPPAPSSVIAVLVCSKLSALAVVDVEATVHPVNLEGLSKSDAMRIMQTVPANRVMAITLPCPDVSHDGTIF